MEILIGNKYRINRKIGSGAFGEVYQGISIETNEEVAIKLENINAKHPQLLYEARLYKIFQGGPGIPNIHWQGVEGDYNVIVIDLLGPSLGDLLVYCGGTLSLKTVCILAEQMISRIEYLHEKRFIHRDVEPNNFLIGRDINENQVFIIDFGLCKKYWNSETNSHITYKEGKSMSGYSKFSSVYANLGIEQSRRDDLESLGYIISYFLKGNLPWQGLPGNNRREKYQNIIERKRNISLNVLSDPFPSEILTYLIYSKSLEFNEKPNYTYLKMLFRNIMENENFHNDFVYDWVILKRTKDNDENVNQLENKPNIENN